MMSSTESDDSIKLLVFSNFEFCLLDETVVPQSRLLEVNWVGQEKIRNYIFSERQKTKFKIRENKKLN